MKSPSRVFCSLLLLLFCGSVSSFSIRFVSQSSLPLAVSLGSTIWEDLAGNVTDCLIQSDRKRDQGFDGASTGWTSWVDEKSSQALRHCLDSVCLASSNEDMIEDELTRSCFQWLSSCPYPALINISDNLRRIVAHKLVDFEEVGEEMTTNESIETITHRIACHMILLPSGASIPNNLQSPPGSMIHGKLLRGGVTRYRLLQGRRTGERRQVTSLKSVSGDESLVSWLQYGGPERNYQAVDVGPCILMELILLPCGLQIETPLGINFVSLPISPQSYFVRAKKFHSNETHTQPTKLHQDTTMSLLTLDKKLCKKVAGLEPQIKQIVRRVLDGRVLRRVSGCNTFEEDSGENTNMIDKVRRQEMEELLSLGLQPVRGLLLYGPPGCGKTALAREISNILDAVPPKIVAAPELLDRWVGGSEKMIRNLFLDAEYELKACGGDATKSALHVIVIDEIDAVFRKRSSGEGSAEVTRASAVNQILSKLDGVEALDNVLVIGMTNRKELLDPALLRPGRLEVHVEIPLPDQRGRREILRLHFDALRRNGRLSQPLCRAIDGAEEKGGAAVNRWSRRLQQKFVIRQNSMLYQSKIRDLADSRWTGGWSGADIAGLVRSAGSLAITRTKQQGGTIPEDLFVTLEDVQLALKEVKSK